MMPIISHRRFATSDKMAASSGAHICDTDRLQDGIVILSRVVAPQNLPAIRSIATTGEEEVVQRNDNVEDAVTITATQSGGVVMQPGGVLRQSGVLPEGSGAACIQLPGSHTSCNAASFPFFNSVAVHREGQMDAATLPGGVVMQPGGVLRHSGALPEGSGAACIQLPGSHTSCNAASFPSFNPFLVHTSLREGQTVLGSGATVQSSCIPTSCSIVSVAGDLPLKVMEGHSEISRDDVIEPERIAATQSSSSLTSYISQGESHYEDLCFIPRKCSDSASSRRILEVIQKTTFDVPPAGHISVARVLLY
ncbi:uncharacterized protein [Dysidea avara]|uniref:uncharacterized protein n=1 Tax=Dysidea avara TaxID=196820 RepID=UPI003321E016